MQAFNRLPVFRRLRTRAPLLVAALAIPWSATGLEVTGGFTGWWGQPEQENHGLIVAVSRLPDGELTAAMYWANFDDEGNPAWIFAQGEIDGNTINADMYRFDGVTFMQPDDPNNDPGERIGTMEVQFDSCSSGEVSFASDDDASTNVIVGTGGFTIQKLTNQPGTECTGGISDNTGPRALPEEFEVELVSTGAVPGAGGQAEFESTPGRAEFSVEIENLPAGDYTLRVGGIERGQIAVDDEDGEITFRSPAAPPGTPLLDFDPRDRLIEVLDGATVVLEGVAPEAGTLPGQGQGTPPPFGNAEIEAEFDNPGVIPEASGEAELVRQPDRVDFDVEIEDVPAGPYTLFIDGAGRGTIQVEEGINGTEGELEFRFPVEPGKMPLSFDPRGATIEVRDAATTILSVDFPGGGDGEPPGGPGDGPGNGPGDGPGDGPGADAGGGPGNGSDDDDDAPGDPGDDG